VATENDTIHLDEEDAKYAQVPADFPKPGFSGAVPGAQPKLLATEYKGRYYAAGATPPEIHAKWMYCEDLARQFVDASKNTKAGKRADMREVEILDQYFVRLLKTGWTSDAEARWVFRRTAALLGWPAPPSALEVDSTSSDKSSRLD
jgi:hypothetical protein